MKSLGLLVNEGKIVDASFVEVPRQRNIREENDKIKSGEGDDLRNDRPYKKRQKDMDARRTEKGGEKFFGYKDHAKVDAKSKLTDSYCIASAEVHDKRSFRNSPLTEEHKALNRAKSRTRCRVEHAFGFVSNSMNDFYIRCIGLRRDKGVIGLINLTCNLCRYEQIVRHNLLPVRA